MAGTRIESKPERIRSLEAAAGSPQSAAYGRAPVCCPGPGRQAQQMRSTRKDKWAQGSFEFTGRPSPKDRSNTPARAAEPDIYYKTVFETMTEGALILSPDGVIIHSNPGFSDIVNLPPQKLAGTSISRLVLDEDRALLEGVLKNGREDQTQAEVVRLSAGSCVRSVRLSATARTMGDQARICMVVTDITSRMEAEDALKQTKDRLNRAVETLQESQAKYIGLFEHANDIVFTLDLQGKFTSANGMTYRKLGLEPNSIIGKNFHDIFTSEHPKFASGLIERVLANKPHLLEDQPWELEAAAADGSVINFEMRAHFMLDKESLVGIRGVVRDITERQQVEMELSRLATAIEQAVESVIILDKNGKIQYANKAFFRISGYCKEEVLGRTTAFLKSNKKDDETFYRGMLSTVSTKSVWTGRISNRKKDGSMYEAETTISPVRDKSGKVVNYVAVERDVTEEVRLERQLRQMQKMEAIGTLAGGIAHDFNNILSAIIGFSEMSIEDIDEGHPAKHYASQILRAATRGKDLVRQILVFSHRNEEERKHFKLGGIIKEALRLLRASLPSTIEIAEHVEEESGVIFACPTQIHQVLMNLCTNAGHAMRIRGGVLDVSLSDFVLDSATEAPSSGMEPGSYLKISVADTGEGITPDILDRIYDPFFTTKSPSEGTGMGLAVVHGIVKSHGGAITVKSTPGRGSVFNVYFPRIDQTFVEETEVQARAQHGDRADTSCRRRGPAGRDGCIDASAPGIRGACRAR